MPLAPDTNWWSHNQMKKRDEKIKRLRAQVEALRSELEQEQYTSRTLGQHLESTNAELAVMRETLERIVHDWDGEPEDMQEAIEALTTDAGKAAANVLAAAKLVADHDGGGNTWHTLKEVIYRAYRGEQ